MFDARPRYREVNDNIGLHIDQRKGSSFNDNAQLFKSVNFAHIETNIGGFRMIGGRYQFEAFGLDYRPSYISAHAA